MREAVRNLAAGDSPAEENGKGAPDGRRGAGIRSAPGVRFAPVPAPFDYPALEAEVLAFWRADDTFRKSLEDRAGAPVFSFYEGPPTANGLPHIGHVIPRALKDLIPRYKAMRGYRVPRKAGWDTHGLPVELEVEKELGLESKAAIEAFGVEAFVERCRASVFRYEQEWARLTERIGFWLDLEHPYVTFHNDYIESVWWSLRRLWDAGLLYQAHKVVPYCPRCGTSLSSHEVAQGYAEADDPSLVFLAPVAGPGARGGRADAVPEALRGAAFLVWTTTPWTLPANTALAVDPDAEYAVVEVPGEAGPRRLVLAANRLEAVLGAGAGARVEARLAGRDLLGTGYEPPFRFLEAALRAAGERLPPAAFTVLGGDFVALEEGTGIVHVAPAFGEDDLRLGRAHGLPVFQPVDGRGRFTGAVAPWAGRWVKDADPDIVAALSARGRVWSSGRLVHPYPFCWRCDHPLLYYARTAWFIRMTALRDRLLEANAGIRWVPDHLRDGRFGKFLESVVDWCLDRDRYWGTPLPVWTCEACGARHCVGSIAELRQRVHVEATAASLAAAGLPGPGEPRRRVAAYLDGLDLHKPYVDRVRLRCHHCGGAMAREPGVIDCWYDSGAMPFAQHHYPFENAEAFEETFPADYICEAIDQTRGWFYSLLAEATALFGRTAYRTVLCTEFGLDAEGQKMSKHKGNVLDPWVVLDSDGADALRWYCYVSSPPWQPKRFDRRAIGEARSAFLDTIWHCYNFLALYAGAEGWRPAGPRPDPRARPALDRWILSRLQAVTAKVRDELDTYQVTPAARALAAFVDDLSNWYVRRSRRRFWRAGAGAGGAAADAEGAAADQAAAFATLYECLHTLARLVAPFVPFLAEGLYRRLEAAAGPAGTGAATGPASVHRASWPEPDPSLADPALEAAMEQVRAWVALGRAARSEARLRTRQPLARGLAWGAGRSGADPADFAAGGRYAGLVDLLADELNVKTVEVRPAGAFGAAGAVASGGGGSAGGSGWAVAEGPAGGVALWTVLDDDLRLEGLARDLSSRLQRVRREAGLEVTDRIHLRVAAEGEAGRAFDRHRGWLAAEVLATRAERVPDEALDSRAMHAEGGPARGWATADFRLQGDRVRVAIRRAG